MAINRPVEAPLSSRTEPPAPGTTQPFGQRELDAIHNAVTAVSIANRQTMPQIAATVDQLKAVFGQVRVIHAREGGYELGREPPLGVIAHAPHVPIKKRSKRL